MVGCILGVDVVTAISSSLSGEVNTTSYTAHLSGVVMGIMVGVVMLKNRRVQFWEQWLRVACCALAAVFMLVMIVINIFFSSFFMTPDSEDAECSMHHK